MKYLRITVCGIAMLFMANGLAQTVSAQIPALSDCSNMTSQQLANFAKKDFLQDRLPRWDETKKALGSGNPVVWVNENDIVAKGDSRIVPLKVRGRSSDKQYMVNIDCQKSEISYTEQTVR